jgi:hypothetical protein
MTRTKLQTQHRRQSELPEAFALATLASANREAKPAHRGGQAQDRAKAARKVAQLLRRGEL